MTAEKPDQLVEWLVLQLDEDDRLARDVIDEVGPERVGDSYDDGTLVEVDSFPRYPWGSGSAELAYMAGPGHPERLLAEVRAKRWLLEALATTMNGESMVGVCDDACECVPDRPGEVGSCMLVRALARPYADRPGFREEWRIGSRTPGAEGGTLNA